MNLELLNRIIKEKGRTYRECAKSIGKNVFAT